MNGLFDGLFDDAALFPPGDAPMATAVPAHRRLREHLGAVTGPFLVPAARLEELAGCVGEGAPLAVSLIGAPTDLPDAVARVDADERLTLAAVEVPVVADAAAARAAVQVLDDLLPEGVPAAVELPRSPERDAVLDVLAGTDHRAKLRTGGLRAELFPAPDELAAALHACSGRGVALKCTAGLHSAVGHTDPATGFAHHGFLNVLAAVDALVAGGSPDHAADRLRDTDADGLAADLGAWSADRVAGARAVFTSFGTCSVTEPVDDLVALGLLPVPAEVLA